MDSKPLDPISVTPKRSTHKVYDKKVHGKRYTLTQKLAVKALVESGMSQADIARSENLSKSTVYSVMKDKSVEILSPDKVNAIKKSLTGMMYGNAYRAQEKITDDKLDAMNAYQLSLISSINVDKSRLMEGLSTENHSHLGFIGNLEADRERLMKRIDNLDEK